MITKLIIIINALVLFLTACGSPSQGEAIRDELNPINDRFIVEKHEDFANFLQDEQGYSKETADEEAFQVQLREVALLNKATEAGIEVSEEQALERAEENRVILDSGEAVNAEFVLEKLDELINELNITKEEYWTDYVLNDIKMQIMIEELRERELKESPGMNWNERSQEIIEEFKQNETEQIEEFKNEIGMG